jgi:hypothetical protein
MASTSSRRLVLAGPGSRAVVSTGRPRATGQIEPTDLVNPIEAYPLQPFPQHQQEWREVVSRMQPHPGHGKPSYEGTGQLVGRRALISGGDWGRAAAPRAIDYLAAERPDEFPTANEQFPGPQHLGEPR